MAYSRDSVFLNIPYDNQYKNLYFAFIAGLCSFALTPRATLEIAGAERRLDRICRLMADCEYSFHDLSRVQLDLNNPRTPRFNMPFELGLLLGWRKARKKSIKTCFIFEAVKRRLNKSLSDVDGIDPYIHDGKVKGVFRELGNAMVKRRYQPTVQQMYAIYRNIKADSPQVMRLAGAKTLFEARVFKGLVVLATGYAEKILSE